MPDTIAASEPVELTPGEVKPEAAIPEIVAEDQSITPAPSTTELSGTVSQDINGNIKANVEKELPEEPVEIDDNTEVKEVINGSNEPTDEMVEVNIEPNQETEVSDGVKISEDKLDAEPETETESPEQLLTQPSITVHEPSEELVTDESIDPLVVTEETIPEGEQESVVESVSETPEEPISIRVQNPRKLMAGHFLVSSFTVILDLKEAKKHPQLKEITQKALDTLTTPEPSIHVIFDALKAACESSNNYLKVKAIDIFAKSFDYGFFDDEPDVVALTDKAVDLISGCFEGEGTDAHVETQVLRALTNSILIMPCHGASLLKAVRQIYNIFIFSLLLDNQLIAQGTLNQVINAIFSKISEKDSLLHKRLSISLKDSKENITSNSSVGASTSNDINETNRLEAPLTLQSLERDAAGMEDEREFENSPASSDSEIAVKDAFLIFRAMCKLSVKLLEELLDMRLHLVRSKLLSLHIIHTILKDHIDIFLLKTVVLQTQNESTRLTNAIRQYLSLLLSRNAASPLTPVFELSLEIFWLLILNLRLDFKREIPLFFDEIYLPIAEMKTLTPHQKRYFLSIIGKLCNDLRCIIEFYLNYDCDPQMPNICEKIIDYLTKLLLVRVDVTPQQKAAYKENKKHGISVYDITKTATLALGKMSLKPPEPDVYNNFPLEYALQMESIESLVAFLKLLFSWAQKVSPSSVPSVSVGLSSNGSSTSLRRPRSDTYESNHSSAAQTEANNSLAQLVDENSLDAPEQFETLKQRKKAYLEGIKQFNIKPKKGIKYLIENGFITDDKPESVAQFLLETDLLDKAQIGEYLGEGDEKNIAIMHSFVDMMDFSNLPFVELLRRFLQLFRLPGEAQKIDRFMLKFAERYLMGNPTVFSNADAAYVLAYSVILLNTDQHSPQIKNRMTFESFLINNAGIDDGKDLPKDMLQEIYDEIVSHEIKLQSEQHAALIAGDNNVINNAVSGSSGFFGGRDARAEAYTLALRELSTKTEKLVRSLGKKVRLNTSLGVFYVASNIYHVRLIFDTLWMSILAGLTPPFKAYDDKETTSLCLEGIKLSIRISCMFDIDYARTSFLRALSQFANLNSYEEMKFKNVDAVMMLLEIAVLEGDRLGTSWTEILTSISQLERLQLIAQGVDQTLIPDVVNAKLNRLSTDQSTVGRALTLTGFFSFLSAPTALQTASQKFHNQHLSPEVAALLIRTDLEVAIDRVFLNSAKLSKESIVVFVKALSQVSKDEIELSGQSSNPRMFLLQKVVDVCYYNMLRIRLEWSQLWAIMGKTFNEVGCHLNLVIAFFALDSLRQLLMRFFEIEELAHFKFQREFLKPFEHILRHNDLLEVKDMVLECVNNMVLAKAEKIKSGWMTIFAVLTAAANENKENLVYKAYKMANSINKEYQGEVRNQELFSELVVCFTELAKNERFQRISLLSLDVLLKLIRQVASTINFNGKNYNKDQVDSSELEKLLFPVLFAFYDIIMTGEELEVRSRALNALFTVLMEYGDFFPDEFWNLVSSKLLFPIFSVLSNHWELSNVDENDKLSVWLSTTLIQALRNMITLFTRFYEPLGKKLEQYLNLLILCICQENDTIARIGRLCLHSLLIENATKFGEKQWIQVINSFENLFYLTTANELFSKDPLIETEPLSPATDAFDEEANKSVEIANNANISFKEETEARLRKLKEKLTIVVKCVLQLLMIETLSEIFENEAFYESIPFEFLIQLSDFLKNSYTFAKKFNDDYDLRVRLYNAGIIERLPNLLKQELSLSAVYINILFRMYCDDDKTNNLQKQDIIANLIPLCEVIVSRYAQFDEQNQQRNINTWRPVVIEIFQGYVELDDDDFLKHSVKMYKLGLKLIAKQLPQELRVAMKVFFARVGDIFVYGEKSQTV